MFVLSLASCGWFAAPPPPPPTLIEVAHRRELRGGWIATVDNINWPSAPGLSPDVQKRELEALFEVSAKAGLNAIFFQIRPEADALYRSELEPWSRYVGGSQGADPGYDPLELAIELAHARGMELHAWFNPYRAGLKHTDPVTDNHVAVTLADHVHAYGTHRWMDPGAPEVQDHVANVIEDVVRRYDVDGVHFDDYFYPYPTDERFPDEATYEAHGGGLELSAWRRANVDQMVARIARVVRETKSWVRFGISPFGLYRPNQPPGIAGFDQYSELNADPPKWKADGLVDYLAPQLYWPIEKTKQPYEPLLAFWSDLPGPGYTFPGNFLAKLGNDDRFTVDEFRREVALTRKAAEGNIWFHVGPLLENDAGIRDVFGDELYATPALLPPVFALRDKTVTPPTAERREDGAVRVTHDDARAWVIYVPDGEGWSISQIVPASNTLLDLEGRFVVTAVGRHGVESSGLLVE